MYFGRINKVKRNICNSQRIKPSNQRSKMEGQMIPSFKTKTQCQLSIKMTFLEIFNPMSKAISINNRCSKCIQCFKKFKRTKKKNLRKLKKILRKKKYFQRGVLPIITLIQSKIQRTLKMSSMEVKRRSSLFIRRRIPKYSKRISQKKCFSPNHMFKTLSLT